MTIRERLEKEMDKQEIKELEEENDEIKDKTTKDGILRLLRESGVPEEKLNEVYNALFEKVKKEGNDDNSECNKMDDFDTDINSDSD